MRVRAFSSILELPPSYAELFSNAEKQSVFFARAWFERLSEHFVKSLDLLRLYGVEDDDQALALLFAVRPEDENRVFRVRTLQGLTTTQSFRSSLLFGGAVDKEEALIATLFGHLRNEDPKYECIDLDLLCISDAQALKWSEAIRSTGFLCHVEQQDWNRYEDVSNTPFSKLAKKSTRRRERKLAKSIELDFQMYTEPEDMPKAQAAYEDIYRRTWKKPDIGREFAADLIMDFSARGWVRFLVMYAGDRPIAAECFLVHAGIANSFRTAYDLDYRDFSVGSIVLQRMLEHVMTKDEVREIDFGPGDEPYKKQWLSKKRKLWRIRAFDDRQMMGKTGYAIRVLLDEFQRAKDSRLGRVFRRAKTKLNRDRSRDL